MKNPPYPYYVRASKEFAQTEGLNLTNPYVEQSMLAKMAIALQSIPESITTRKIGAILLVGATWYGCN